MNRRFLLLGLTLLLLLPFVSPATAQSSDTPTISLNNQYIVNGLGFVILNETVTFTNNGNSSMQIPTVQVGIPDTIASHAVGFVLASKDQYSQTSADNGNVTTFTISPSSPNLAASSASTVSLKSFITGALHITPGVVGNISALLMLSPSFSEKVSLLNMEVVLPASGMIIPVPAGFGPSLSANAQAYASAKSNVVPTIQTQTALFSDSSATSWHPLQVYSVIRTIIPTTNGVPQVKDQLSVRNLGATSITSLPLTLLVPNVKNVTIVPSSTPPIINPTVVSLTNGALNLASPPFSSPIQAGNNFTFSMVYSIPSTDVSTSGSTVSVNLPYTLPFNAIIQNYTVRLALPTGMVANGPAKVSTPNATPLLQGSSELKYTITPGWAVDQAVPAGALLFAASFILLTLGRSETAAKEEEEEESEELGDMLADLIKALEEKISLSQQFQTDMAKKSQGTVSRADFNKMKNELDALKGRAIGRLNAVRQAAESQRYLDLLNQLQEAEREEDRAAKDLLNLYDQYQSKRMREETFKRLLPSYKKRLDSATNHLSDLLNLAQREGKQG